MLERKIICALVSVTWKPRMALIQLFFFKKGSYSSFDYENYPFFFQLTCVCVYECVCVYIHVHVLIS